MLSIMFALVVVAGSSSAPAPGYNPNVPYGGGWRSHGFMYLDRAHKFVGGLRLREFTDDSGAAIYLDIDIISPTEIEVQTFRYKRGEDHHGLTHTISMTRKESKVLRAALAAAESVQVEWYEHLAKD